MSWDALPPGLQAALAGGGAAALAARHGTPFYVYDVAAVRARIATLRAACRRTGLRLLFAAKANPHRGLLAALRADLDGLDVASAGEIARAEAAGFAPALLSFAGPGKDGRALRVAVERGVRVSAESPRELASLRDLAAELGKPARVMLRINPSLRLHAFAVAISGTPSPFGIDAEELAPALSLLQAAPDLLDAEGVHIHAGSQCRSTTAWGLHARGALELADRVAEALGRPCREVNLGGGLGVSRDGSGAPLDIEAFGARLAEAWGGRSEALCLEPGRWLVAEAGAYVARVVATKTSRGRRFAILDGGMNHHLDATGHLAGPRPAPLPVINLSRAEGGAETTLVGPLCTPLDVLAQVELAAEPGDLLAFARSGAYGLSFSPAGFLGHAPPAELLLEGGRVS